MPLIDAIAVATEEERKTSDFAAAEKAEAMFSIAQQTWQYRINSMIIGSRTNLEPKIIQSVSMNNHTLILCPAAKLRRNCTPILR